MSDYTGAWKYLYDWQTLVAGILAIAGALIAYAGALKAANRQVSAADRQVKATQEQMKQAEVRDLEEDRRRKFAITWSLRNEVHRLKELLTVQINLIQTDLSSSKVAFRPEIEFEIALAKALRGQRADIALLALDEQVSVAELVFLIDSYNAFLMTLPRGEGTFISTPELLTKLQELSKAADVFERDLFQLIYNRPAPGNPMELSS